MATTIDQKVVEMRFDNRDFEKNTRQTMSTLDKLKSKLHFKGASDGLAAVGAAAKKINMNTLANGIQTVSAKFSAMEVAGITALANITNSAVNAGKNIVRSLTVAPVSDGWKEYELTMNTIQTISNSTGKSIDEIKGKLKALDDYADKTVYSTADMFNNIYKFTNAGIDLDTATKAMIGIANATADAGQGAQQASIAYYNLAQSLSTGYLTTIDYKSINAQNIITVDFKKRLAEIAVQMGTLKKVGDNLYSTGKKSYNLQQLFSEALSDQWATTDVMMQIFKEYASEETEIGKRANKAATEVKTFTGMMESLKASAGTGWKETWEIIFGDLDQAKETWTGLSNFIGGIINAVDNFRNSLLKNAFNFDGFQAVMDKINNNTIVKTMSDVSDKIRTITRSLEEYQGVVSRVWRGDYNNRGDNPDRFDLLTQEGWNAEVVQELVNKGYEYKLTIDDCKKAEEKYGIVVEQTVETQEENIETMQELTEERLKQLGLSEEEIKLYKQLESASIKYGISIDDLLAKMKKSTGRDLLFGKKKRNEDGSIYVDPNTGEELYDTIGVAQNIAGSLINVFNSIKKAWTETFEGLSSIDLYIMFENLNKFSVAIKKATENEKGMRNLKDTFKGLFAILKLTSTIVGGGLKIAWTIFKTILETCGVSVLDFTGAIGNMVSSLVNFITENDFIIQGIIWLTKIISKGIISIYDWASSFISINEAIHVFQNGLNKAKENFNIWFDGLKKLKKGDEIAKYIIDGLVNGITKYGKKAWDTITSFVITFINKAKEVLGIHSPSKEFFYMGVNIVKGLYNGILSLVGIVYKLVTSIGEKLVYIVQSMDFGALLLTALGAGLFTFVLVKVAKLINIFADGISSINGVISGVEKVLKSFAGVMNAIKFKVYIDSIKSLAIAIGILVGAVVVLTLVDENEMWRAIDGIMALVGLLSSLLIVAGIASKIGKANFAQLAATVLAVGLVFAIAGSVVKKLGKLPKNEVDQGISAMSAFVGMIVGLMAATKLLSGSKNIVNFGNMILKVGVVFYLMSMAVSKAGKLSIGEAIQGTLALTAFTGMIVGLMAATKLLLNSKNIDKFGNAILKIGAVFYLMSMVVSKLGQMDIIDILIGMGCVTAFAGIIVGLMAATKLIAGGKNVEAIGRTIQSVGTAILLMAVACRILGSMDIGALIKGGVGVAVFTGIIIGLIYALKKIGGKDIDNINRSLLGISLMIMSMAISTMLLGLLDVTTLVKGITAIGFLTLFVKGLVKATGQGKDLGKSLYPIVAAIAVLTLCVIGLSLLDPKKLIPASIAMGLLMGIFSIMIKATKQLEEAKNLTKNLLLMLGTIVVLTAVVAGLSFINADNALKASMALTLIIIGLTACLFALQKMSEIKTEEIVPKLVNMLLILAVMFAATQVLKQLDDVGNVTQAAIALSILMGSLTIILVALGAMGSLTTDALLGVVGLMGLMVAVYLAVDILSKMENVKNAMTNASALVAFIGGLTLILLITAAVGAIYLATAGIGATGILGLYLLIPMCYALIDILTKMNKVQNAQTNVLLLTALLGTMTDMLFKIAIVGPLALMAVSALYALMAIMPVMMAFAIAIGALITYIPQIKKFLDTGLPVMIQVAGAIGEMIGAFIKGTLTQISSALPVIGANLSLFMLNATPFIMGMKIVDGQTLKGTAIMAGAILALTAVDVINAIASFFTGGFAELGTELSMFALNALPFIATMSMVSPAAMSGVKSLAEAVLILTAANLLDGLSRFLGGGGASLSAFSTQLPPLGAAMSEFVTNLGVFTEDQVTTTDCAGRAISALAEAAKSLPKSGGWAQKIFGEGSLKDFANDMPVVAQGVVDFVSTLGTFSQPQINTANAACEVIKAIAKAADSVKSEGGLWQKLFGSDGDGLAKFANNMPKVGEGVRKFINELDSVKDKSQVADAGANIVSSIAKLADVDLKKANDRLPKFGDTMLKFGDKLKSFIDKLKVFTKEDVETVNNNLVLITDATQNMMNTVNNGITDNSDKITDNMYDVVTKAAETIGSNDILTTIKNKARDFVQGFANGITNNQELAYSAAYSVGQRATAGLTDSIDSNSPSKEAMYRGEYFGEGFAIGIEEYSSKVYRVSEGIGEQAKNGLTTAIAKISNAIDSDIDSNPTIRPVLDLSDISNGINRIDSMFGSPNLQVMSNLNSISSGMNSRIQNGNNSDVISAINKLGKSLGSSNSNTYNINGITYNDNSNINNAVRDLIRAIEMEGRI